MIFVRVHCTDYCFYQCALPSLWFLSVFTVQVIVSISVRFPVDDFCPCPLSRWWFLSVSTLRLMVSTRVHCPWWCFLSHRCPLFNWFLLSVHVIKVLVSVSAHCLGHGFWQCPLSRWWFLSGSSPSYNFYQSVLSRWWFLPVSIVQVMDSVLKRHSRESFWQYALSRWWFLSVYTAHWWWFLSVASVQEDCALLFALHISGNFRIFPTRAGLGPFCPPPTMKEISFYTGENKIRWSFFML